MSPACPSCGTVLVKTPSRKTQCQHCGDFMYFKATPDNRTKRLMTQIQADKAEAAWSQFYEKSVGRTGEALEVRYARALLAVEVDLAKARKNGFSKVQIFGADDKRCTACAGQDRKIVSSAVLATDIIPSDCNWLQNGWSHCLLMVSAAIKDSCGKFRFQRQ